MALCAQQCHILISVTLAFITLVQAQLKQTAYNIPQHTQRFSVHQIEPMR